MLKPKRDFPLIAYKTVVKFYIFKGNNWKASFLKLKRSFGDTAAKYNVFKRISFLCFLELDYFIIMLWTYYLLWIYICKFLKLLKISL